MKSILRLPDVKGRTALSTSEIYRRMEAGTFPRPVPLGTRARGWLAEEVDAWVAGLMAQRDAAAQSGSGKAA